MKRVKKVLLSTVLAVTIANAGGKVQIATAEPVMVPSPSISEQIANSNLLDGLYAGVGLTANLFSTKCFINNTRIKDITYGGTVKLGYDLNQYLGFEARYSYTPIEKDFMKMSFYGLFIKPQYIINDHIRVYGLVGYGKNKVTSNKPIRSKSTFAIGAGAEYFIKKIENNNPKGASIWIDTINTMRNDTIGKNRNTIVSGGISYNF